MDEETRQALQDVLTAADGGTELYDKILNSVNTLKSKANMEKTLGVKTKKAGDKLRTDLDGLSASLQAVGYDPEAGVELDDFLGSLKGSLKEKKSPGKKSDDGTTLDYNLEDQPAFKKLQKQLTQTQTELSTSQSKVQKAEKDKKNNIIQKHLLGAFKNAQGNATHYGVESRVENLILTNKLGVNAEDSKVYWRDPSDEDKEISFDEGFKVYLGTPDVKRDLRSTQHEGGGSSSGGAGAGGKATDTERIAQINAKSAFSFVK